MIRAESSLSELARRYFGGSSPTPIEDWSNETLRAYQQDALAEQLEHVYANNEFYRGKCDASGVKPGDFHSLDDFARFPFTEKDELRGKPWALLSVPKSEVCLTHTSTGTTGGEWSYVHYTWDDMHAGDWAPFPHRLMDIQETDVVVNALPYEMSSAGQSFQRSLQGAAGALVVPVGKGGFYSEADKTVRVMADLKADVLITTPPYAMLLSEVAEAFDLRSNADIGLRLLWLTGEGCSPAYRRRLQDLWNCPAYVFYGSLECGPIGIECREQSGCHISSGYVYLEIVDPETGQPKPPGEVGEVVCTTLQRKAAPLIRFRTQDLAMIQPEPCSCGVVFPKLHIRGRVVDQVKSPAAGRNESGGKENCSEEAISPYAIEEVLYSQSEMGANYQIYIVESGLRIEAELAEGVDDGEPTRKRILNILKDRGIKAELEWVEHIPRTGGKTRRVRPFSQQSETMAQPCVLHSALKK